ncbi:Ig-like domain-containing protein [Salmonella enterica subsp. enterica serovar Johannesburg]|nr:MULTISPECIES: Ig-like domain-containing protein [Enterobacter cloacae complex]EAS2531024.1 DNA breaking-rejoining protein [Salmonella enterica]EBA9638282.1 DNA breaking-rejoining protein [Salmonella enterica subsp. enterica serovar Johannesburg]EBD8054686.1 DNA breaking-rejoining protein [Salmonella enterica subsp. enterica serovar Johannesburg]EBH5305709.1 DNA breaking-rejoining protein [Salmonella enterica subsp. enterica serovar Johannesburg]ECC5540030.1 DNA breaking-rejoining protein [S
MANCQNSNERLFGGAVVLEVADGCPDVKPLEAEWMALAAGTTKGFDFNPNTTTSDADDGGGYVETIVTNSDFTISFDGEVRVKDKLDQYGFGRFTKYFHTEVAARRQPGIWVRLNYGPVEFIGYMNITALNSSGGTNDITPFTTEFKVGDASTIEVNENNSVAVTGVTVTPTTSTGTAGGTSTFTVNIAPTGATNKDFTVATTDATKATATASGNTVTVTRVATGSAQIIINTEDGNFVAVHTVTVT